MADELQIMQATPPIGNATPPRDDTTRQELRRNVGLLGPESVPLPQPNLFSKTFTLADIEAGGGSVAISTPSCRYLAIDNNSLYFLTVQLSTDNAQETITVHPEEFLEVATQWRFHQLTVTAPILTSGNAASNLFSQKGPQSAVNSPGDALWLTATSGTVVQAVLGGTLHVVASDQHQKITKSAHVHPAQVNYFQQYIAAGAASHELDCWSPLLAGFATAGGNPVRNCGPFTVYTCGNQSATANLSLVFYSDTAKTKSSTLVVPPGAGWTLPCDAAVIVATSLAAGQFVTAGQWVSYRKGYA